MENNITPLVCLIMPVYNGEKTIKYAISSLLRQTYKNWTCIIINDGSNDRTSEILSAIDDQRFQIVNIKINSGRGIARDEGLKRAKGKYLAYIDADDMMHKDKIRAQVEYLESHPEIRMVSCGSITFSKKFEALRALGTDSFASVNVMRYGQALPLLPGATMVRLVPAKTFTYNHFLDVGEDYDYLSRYCDGYKYANIGGPYYYYQTGNVTAMKLLYYQVNNLKVFIASWKMGYKKYAIKGVIKRMCKLLCYIFLLLFVNANKLAEKRAGIKVTNQQRGEFDKEIHQIMEYCKNDLNVAFYEDKKKNKN